METTAMPTMKPVLITKVSDDIRALRGTDVSQQQTALSARAVSDIFAGDLVSASNVSDEKYFVTSGTHVGKIDVNLLVDSGCRYLPANSIVNGPEHATTDSTPAGDPLGGFMYTLAVLPDGELFWGGMGRGVANGGISYDVISAPSATRTELSNGSIIRQVFWVHSVDENDVVAYTRIGHYNNAVGVKKYEWGDWTLLGGEMLYIVVTDPFQDEVINPMVNATYSIHCNVSNFVLPDASGYKYGTKIRILQYPDPEAMDRSAWFTRVTYTALDTTKGIDEDFELLCTPSPNRNTARKNEAYLEDLSPTCYEFSVVPIVNETKMVIGRTWQLDVNAEETEFTTGIAELLGSHTDPGVNDFVDYPNLYYKEESTAYSQSSKSTIVFNRAMPCTGYVNGVITKLKSSLADGWNVVIKSVATTTEANFELVNTTNPSLPAYTKYPSSGVMYYNKRVVTESGVTRNVFELAIDSSGDYDPGYLNEGVQFPAGTDYYTLSSSAVQETICSVSGKDLDEGQTYVFHKYFNRHNVIYVSIQPTTTQDHITVRASKMAAVQIGVTPDPHRGSYISRQNLNRSAYTEFQFQRLKERNEFCTDLIDTKGHSASTEEVPASTKAVVNAHNNLAEKLQAKGLLTGIVDYGNMTDAAIDSLIDTGIYRAVPYDPSGALTPSVNDDTGWPSGTVLSRYADVIVLGGVLAAKNIIHDEMQYIPTTDTEPVASKTYYIWDRTEAKFVLSENSGHPDTFKNTRKPYYVKSNMTYVASCDLKFVSGKDYYRYNPLDGTYSLTTVTVGNDIPQPNNTYFELVSVGIRDTNEITQIVSQYGGRGMNMWYRHKISGGSWCRWMRHVRAPIVIDYTSVMNIDVSVMNESNPFNLGVPTIKCGAAARPKTTVKLPLASAVFPGDRIDIEFTGTEKTSSLSIYESGTATPKCTCAFTGSGGDYNTIQCVSDGSTWYFTMSKLVANGSYGPETTSDGSYYVLANGGDVVNGEVVYYVKSGGSFVVASPQPTAGSTFADPNETYWINTPRELNRVKDPTSIATQVTTLSSQVVSLNTSVTNLSNSVDELAEQVETNTTNIATLDSVTTEHTEAIEDLNDRIDAMGVASVPCITKDVVELTPVYQTCTDSTPKTFYSFKIVCTADASIWPDDGSTRLVNLDVCIEPDGMEESEEYRSEFEIYAWTPDMAAVSGDYEFTPAKDKIGRCIAYGHYVRIYDPNDPTATNRIRGWWFGSFPVKKGTIFTVARIGSRDTMRHQHTFFYKKSATV